MRPLILRGRQLYERGRDPQLNDWLSARLASLQRPDDSKALARPDERAVDLADCSRDSHFGLGRDLSEALLSEGPQAASR